MIKVNGKEVFFDIFPNGETKLIESSLPENVHSIKNVSFKYESDADLIKLMFVKNYIDTKHSANFIPLTIYYMPYSRLDRSEDGSAFTLKYIANFINSLKFKKVKIIEPHSDVTPALVDNSESIYVNFDLLPKVIEEIGFDVENDYLVFPDVTANRKYSKAGNFKSLTGLKKRDFKTGKITSLELAGNVDNKGFKALLIDDLSSYGGTFLMTAEKLKELGAGEIYLLVGHCEDSIFNGDVFKTDLINKVFTTSTILTKKNEYNSVEYKDRIKVYDIEELLNEINQ